MKFLNDSGERVSFGHKLIMSVLYSAFYLVFYIVPNFWPLQPPKYLPLMLIDHEIPLIPWTFGIYLSLYVLSVSVVLLISERKAFAALTRMTLGGFVLCGLFFLFLPTAYPRPAYPVENNSVLSFMMGLIASFDTPNNCFPSNHVFMTGVSTWIMRTKGPKWFYPYVLWALAIFVSTLTTKQHYFVDILGGLAIVGLMASLEQWRFNRNSALSVYSLNS